jgi:uncharacterized protein (TIGR00369 family)
MIELPPYADFLGITVLRDAGGALVFSMPFGDAVTGRPGYLHGGAIAGLLEIAAVGALRDALGAQSEARIKPINVTTSFMRGGVPHETFASATVTRLGARVANVEAHAWQKDRARPIAAAQMNLLIRRN